MHFNDELSFLSSQYPFLSTQIEVFSDRFNALGVESYLIGLTAESEGLSLFSSAIDFASFPVKKAYFELLERYAVLSAAKDVSPEEERGTKNWVYSKSSGVAAHSLQSAARESAFLELAERDRILRYWYLQKKPELLYENPAWLSSAFLREYDFFVYSFAPLSQGCNSAKVAAVFAFPKSQKLPFFYGFGAARHLEEAIEKSKREAFQRFGFLYGEEIPTELPCFELTPNFQQEYYLAPQGQAQLGNWLFQSEKKFQSEQKSDAGLCKIKVPEFSEEEVSYIDLTPASVKNSACVYRAEAKNALRLTFGIGHPLVEQLKGSVRLLVHPIA